MEKTVASSHSRRHSTGNLMLELTGYEDVLSRYLSGPFPSCHDNCKPHPPGFDHPTQPKSTRKRSNKTNEESVQGLKKPFTSIPKSPAGHVKITTTSLAKHPVKPQPVESKRHDFKSKPNSEETDPFYIPPSRITRRYSDVNLPTNSLDDLVSPAGGGLVRSSKKYDKKIVSRKDVKPIKRTVKMPVEDGMNSKKLQTLKTLYESTKPRVDHGSKKSKPADQVVQEKNSKSQSQNEERVLQSRAQIDAKSEKDETIGTENQNNFRIATFRVKKTENPTRARKLAKENEEFSSKTLKFQQGKSMDSQSDSNGSKKLKFQKGKVLDENQMDLEDGKTLRRMTSDGTLPTPESNSVSVVLKPCDTEANKQKNIHLNKVIEETASRLIQTRKSKVQALVGAFEMISANEF